MFQRYSHLKKNLITKSNFKYNYTYINNYKTSIPSNVCKKESWTNYLLGGKNVTIRGGSGNGNKMIKTYKISDYTLSTYILKPFYLNKEFCIITWKVEGNKIFMNYKNTVTKHSMDSVLSTRILKKLLNHPQGISKCGKFMETYTSQERTVINAILFMFKHENIDIGVNVIDQRNQYHSSNSIDSDKVNDWAVRSVGKIPFYRTTGNISNSKGELITYVSSIEKSPPILFIHGDKKQLESDINKLNSENERFLNNLGKEFVKPIKFDKKNGANQIGDDDFYR